MQATFFSWAGVGVLEFMMLMSGGGFMGMPPGERDANLVKCPPAETVIFIEWAERAPGKENGPGIDGLMADPEVVAFRDKLEEAIINKIRAESAGSDVMEETMGEAIPEIVTYLIDRPGCLYVTFDPEAADTVETAGPFAPLEMLSRGLRATLILNAGSDAEKVANNLQKIVNLFPADIQTDGLKNQTFPGLPADVLLTLHHHENYFILGYGEGTVDAALVGLNGETEGLAAKPRYTAAMQKTALERTGGAVWVDFTKLLQVANHVAGPQSIAVSAMATMLGIDKVDSIASTTGVVDGQVRSKTFITTGGSLDGLLALAAGRGIRPDDLNIIPADADLLFGLSIDAPRLLETAREFASFGGPQAGEELEKGILEVEEYLDATFEEHIFPGFGDVLIVHDSPSAGGLFVTSLVGSLEVTDRNKAYTAYTGLLDVIKSELPAVDEGARRKRGARLEKAKFLDETIWYINIIGDDDVPFAPSFCMTQNHLHVAAHPQALKAYLRFLQSDEPNFASKLSKAIPMNEGEAFSLAYADTKSLVRYLYSLAPYFGQAVASQVQREGVDIDIFSLPSARALLPYLENAFSTSTRTKDGILLESQSPLPIPGGSSVLSTAPMLLPLMVGFRGLRIGADERANENQAQAAALLLPAGGKVRIRKKIGLRRTETSRTRSAITVE